MVGCERLRTEAVMREMLLRQLIIKWIERDKETLPKMWRSRLFGPFQMRLEKDLVEIRRELRTNAVFVMSEEWNEMDVKIKYKDNGAVKNACYLLPMLSAEAQGKVEIREKENQP